MVWSKVQTNVLGFVTARNVSVSSKLSCFMSEQYEINYMQTILPVILIPGFLNVTHVLDIKVARLKLQAQKWIVCIFCKLLPKAYMCWLSGRRWKKQTLIFLCLFSFGNYEVMTRMCRKSLNLNSNFQSLFLTKQYHCKRSILFQ